MGSHWPYFLLKRLHQRWKLILYFLKNVKVEEKNNLMKMTIKRHFNLLKNLLGLIIFLL
ncbi:unnamed protein product [Prunus brigantina]